jgi:hypothetical protein
VIVAASDTIVVGLGPLTGFTAPIWVPPVVHSV